VAEDYRVVSLVDVTSIGNVQGDRHPTLEAASLYRFFRAGDAETLALQGVSVCVAKGELVAVSGPSGSGKSTLLACLAGMDNPDGGTVRINGQRLSHQPERVQARMRAQSVGLMFQTANMLPHLTVAQNVTLPQRMLSGNRRPVMEILDGLGIGHRASAYPDELSGGELARAGLAVAVANDPLVVLADEPTGELDSGAERAVLGLLNERARAGAAIVVASHSAAVAAAADRVIHLVDGRVE
jgi:putative ABC transport system ATP-binding protein